MSHALDWDSDDEETDEQVAERLAYGSPTPERIAMERARWSQQRRSQERRRQQLSMDRAVAASLVDDIGLEDHELEEQWRVLNEAAEELRRRREGAAGAAGAAGVPAPARAAASRATRPVSLKRCREFKNRDMMKKELDKPPKVSYKVADSKDELCRKLIASGRALRDDEPSPERSYIASARAEAIRRAEEVARAEAIRRAEEVARAEAIRRAEEVANLPRLQVKEVDRIPNRCFDPIVENGIIDYEEGVFQFVYGRIDRDGNFLINDGNNSGCLDRGSLTSMMNQRDDRGNYLNWFYECTGKVDYWGERNTGDEILVKLAFAEGYTVYIPKPLLDSMLANNIYRVGVVTTQRTFNRSASYIFARGKKVRGYSAGVNNDFMSANHCQNGSNITISTLVALRERGERRDAGTRRRTRRMKLRKKKTRKQHKKHRSSKTAF